MKLSVFMNLYNVKKSEEDKEKFVNEHIKGEYIPLEKKADIAKAICDSCYWEKNENDGRLFRIDSIAKYMCTCMAIVELYTDIECQNASGKMLENFNILNGSGVLDIIVKNINQREMKEFNMVLQMTCDDLIANEYENHAFISKQVERFGSLVGTIVAPAIESLDIDKIKEYINMLNQ